MLPFEKLEQLISSRIHFDNKVSATGFHGVKCACCNDYKIRGGWRISSTEIRYNCFNCGIAGSINQGDDHLTKRFIQILKDFGISEREITEVKSTLFFNKSNEIDSISIESLKKINLFTPEVELPKNSIRLIDNPIPEIITYLVDRKIPWDEYPFYVSSDPKLKNRVIIPFYKQNKIIYWQARSVLPEVEPRYKNCEVPKEAIIFNYDALFRYSSKPLFVCEGVFDAILLDGICIIGSKLNEAKIEILRKSSREKIFIIDKDSNGRTLGLQILKEKLGSISYVTNQATSKIDVNKRIIEAGKIWTIYELLNNKISDPVKAELLLKFISPLRRKNV